MTVDVRLTFDLYLCDAGFNEPTVESDWVGWGAPSMMRSVSTLLFILTLLFPVVPVRADKPAPKVNAVKVTIPEGLYLVQPHKGVDFFSLLFIVEKGRLVDPYVRATRMGMKRFEEKYTKGKEFNVYAAGERIGVLSGVTLDSNDKRDMHAIINADGAYRGAPLPGQGADDSVYVDSSFDLDFGTFKAVVTPKAHAASRTREPFKVGWSDRRMANEVVRRELGARAEAAVAVKIAKEGSRVVGVELGRVDSLAAVDLNGNGEKELVGGYYFSIAESDEQGYQSSYPVEISFVIWDHGQLDKVLLEAGSAPAFSLGGMIDIDGDGIYELVMVEKRTLWTTTSSMTARGSSY